MKHKSSCLTKHLIVVASLPRKLTVGLYPWSSPLEVSCDILFFFILTGSCWPKCGKWSKLWSAGQSRLVGRTWSTSILQSSTTATIHSPRWWWVTKQSIAVDGNCQFRTQLVVNNDELQSLATLIDSRGSRSRSQMRTTRGGQTKHVRENIKKISSKRFVCQKGYVCKRKYYVQKNLCQNIGKLDIVEKFSTQLMNLDHFQELKDDLDGGNFHRRFCI